MPKGKKESKKKSAPAAPAPAPAAAAAAPAPAPAAAPAAAPLKPVRYGSTRGGVSGLSFTDAVFSGLASPAVLSFSDKASARRISSCSSSPPALGATPAAHYSTAPAARSSAATAACPKCTAAASGVFPRSST